MQQRFPSCRTLVWVLTTALWGILPLSSARGDASPTADAEVERIRQLAAAPALPTVNATAPSAPAGASPSASPDASAALGESRPATAAGNPGAGPASGAAAHANENKPLGSPSRNPAAAAQPSAPGEPGQAQWIVTTAAALAAVLGLIFVIRAAMVRFGGHLPSSGQSPVLEVMSRVAVAPKSNILIIRLAQRVLVVGETPAGLRTLAEITDPEEVAATLQAAAAGKPGSAMRNFAHVMTGMDRQYDTQPDPRLEGADSGEVRVDQARHRVSALTARLRALGARGGGG